MGERLSVARVLVVALVWTGASLVASTAFAKPPSLAVGLTAPDNGAMYMAPATIPLMATVTLMDDKGKNKKKAEDKDKKKKNHKSKEGHSNPHKRVVKVEFLEGTTVIGTVTAKPYAFDWVNVPAGNYVLRARATNAKGEIIDSIPVAISVSVNVAPTVTLTIPAPNTVVTAPVNLSISADAADSDGTVTQVEFFANGNSIGSATASPFTIQWANVAAGDYTLTARATDNNNAQTTSDPITITVNRIAQVYFIYADHLNTPRVITNQTGQVVWTWASDDPFGANVPNENPSGLGNFTCNLRLPGQYFDQETNTHYNHFRDYDPALARYVQSDPIGLNGGLNTYLYANGNPVSEVDLNGLLTLTLCQMDYLSSNYGMLGGFLTSTFNLQQFIPGLTDDPVRGLTKGAIAGGAKLGVVAGLRYGGSALAIGLSGTVGSDIGMVMIGTSALASGTLAVCSAGLTPFATLALANARRACRDPISGKQRP